MRGDAANCRDDVGTTAGPLVRRCATSVIHRTSSTSCGEVVSSLNRRQSSISEWHRGQGADYLFLKEAYDLPLQHVELAVLSACDTERGQLLRGEGVRSFSRAFLAAGARSTVTTLWRVPDAPTAAFMKVFYYELQRGVPRDVALQTAKLRFARSGRDVADPHDWAAFVLTGEGLRPVPTAIRWSSVAFVFLAAMVLLLVLVFSVGKVSVPPKPSTAA